MSGLSTGQGNKRAPLSERKDDLYETPPEAVKALLRVEDVAESVWEPACGPGKIVAVLRATGRSVLATDLVDYECPDSQAGVDFLMVTNGWRETLGETDCIVTNPPFKLAEQFARHARRLVPQTYMLLRLAFLESQRRTDLLESGDLARVWVFRKRLPMMHRASWEGRTANSGMAFAWFVWDSAHKGPTEIQRLSWETPA
jgi:hypothetical protein